jgi:putative ABC transport system permease protein
MSKPQGRHEGATGRRAGPRRRAPETPLPKPTLSSVTGTGAAASLALAMLVLVCTFIAVAVPRASLDYRTQALQRIFRSASSAQTAVVADADITGLTGTYLGTEQLAASQDALAAGLHHQGLPLAPPATQWSGLDTGSNAFSGGRPPATGAPPVLELMYRNALGRDTTLVAGSMPTSVTTHGTADTFQVAVTAATAAKFGLRAGTRLRLPGLWLVVTGIVRPRHPASSLWTVDTVAAAPELIGASSTTSAPYWSGAAFAGEAELAAMQRDLSNGPIHAVWSFPLSLGSVTADQAAGLLHDLQAVAYLPAATSVGTNLNAAAGQSATITISLSSGLVTTLPSFVATDDAVQRALSLLFVSLAIIAAMVVLLGARLVAEHRDTELTMMRARGASLRQVGTVALAGGAVAVLPAAAAGAGAAVLVTPGPASQLAWWLGALIIVAALAGPPVLAMWRQRTRRDAASSRAGIAAATRRRIAAARRWVFDIALVCAAVGGLVLLRQQGLPPPGSVDLFTSAAPVLVAIPVALLVLRGYPLVLRQLARLAGRRRGVVMVVGLARGGTAARAAVLPTFALVLAFAVIAFAAMARGAVQRADVVASWQAAGADAIVTAPAVGPGIPPAAQHQIAGVPGVQRFTMLSLADGTSGQGLQIPVVIVDPRQYAALTAATPAPPFPGAALAQPRAVSGAPPDPAPALLSTAGRDILGPRSTLFVAGRTLRLRVAGTLEAITGAQPGGQFVVLPRWALGTQAPAPAVMAIIGPHLDTAALTAAVRRAVPGAQVTLRSRLLGAISAAPLPHGGFVTFAQGAAAAGAFSLLILVLTLVLSARSRELTLARLVTMGLGPSQSRRITVVEILPLILAAVVGGTACALALVPLVGPAVNLAAFTGMPVTEPLRAEPLAIVAAAAGLLLLAALTLTIQNGLARSRGTAQALRVGQ